MVILRLFIFLFLLTGISNKAFSQNRGFIAGNFEIPNLDESLLTIGQSSLSELDPNSIKVLVWNLYKGDISGWDNDLSKLVINSDILLLQEGYLNTEMRETFTRLSNFQFDFGISFLYLNESSTPTGSIVGSRVKPTSVGFSRSEGLEPFIKTPKTTTYAYYPIKGSEKKLLALSIHGINFASYKKFVNQIKQSIKVIKSHNGPVIFGGDFNTRSKKRIRFLNWSLKKLGLREVKFENDYRTRALRYGQILDRVYIRGLATKSSKVLSKILTSDHKGLALELKFPLIDE